MNAIPFVPNTKESNIRKDIVSNPEQFVKKLLTGSRFQFGVQNVISSGIYKEMGYMYNLRPYLRKFVVKQYDSWQEMYALNKTNVRQLTIGRVNKIVEIIL